MFELRGRRVFVAGHRGLVGSALLRRLRAEDCEIQTATRDALDLRDQAAVNRWFETRRPEAVFLAAARVGSVLANVERPADFLYDNMTIAANVVEAARRSGVAKLMCFASSCIYPRVAPQPMPEECLYKGPLEPATECSAIAKIATIRLCGFYRRQHGCDFISVLPTTLYGPNDHFDPMNSHVLGALIAKIDDAVRHRREAVTLWGTGRPRREFLHVDDLADAAVFLMRHWSDEKHINIGVGEDVTVLELAERIAAAIGFAGRFEFDTTKPDGSPGKLLDSGKLHGLGWRHRIELDSGIRDTYAWYRQTRTERERALA